MKTGIGFFILSMFFTQNLALANQGQSCKNIPIMPDRTHTTLIRVEDSGKYSLTDQGKQSLNFTKLSETEVSFSRRQADKILRPVTPVAVPKVVKLDDQGRVVSITLHADFAVSPGQGTDTVYDLDYRNGKCFVTKVTRAGEKPQLAASTLMCHELNLATEHSDTCLDQCRISADAKINDIIKKYGGDINLPKNFDLGVAGLNPTPAYKLAILNLRHCYDHDSVRAALEDSAVWRNADPKTDSAARQNSDAKAGAR